MQNTKLNRGDSYAAGLYVGTTSAGVEWVARANATFTQAEAFDKLCERFDNRERAKLIRCSEQVIAVAEDYAAMGCLEHRASCSNVKIGKTVIEGSLAFFSDLSFDLEIKAYEWADGTRSVASECFSRELPQGFVDSADDRISKSLMRWAAKCAKLVGA